MIGHRDFDAVAKGDCPTADDLDALLDAIVSRASERRSDKTQRL